MHTNVVKVQIHSVLDTILGINAMGNIGRPAPYPIGSRLMVTLSLPLWGESRKRLYG